MAEYVVKPDAGFPPVPITDVGEILSFDGVAFTELELQSGGTQSDQKTLWSAQGGSIRCWNTGTSVWVVPYTRLQGSIATGGGERHPTANQKIYMCGIILHVSGTDLQNFYIFFTEADNQNAAVNILNRVHGTDQILYYNTLEAAQSQDMFEISSEWDETPTEDNSDPNNLLPNGGAYADLGAFNDTDQMTESGMPDPSIFEEDTEGLITCYALFGNAFADFGKSVFATGFWQSLANKFMGLSDPISMIIDCVEIPVGNVGSPYVGAAPMALGGIDVPFYNGSNVYIENTWARRYYKKNCGSITLKEVWGSAKDYTDASISIYLPYCGVKELDPDIVLRNTLTLYAYIDLWNGDVLYLLHTSNTGFDKKYFTQEAVVYRWTGNCGKKIPIGKVDTSNAILQVASGIATVGLGVAAGTALGGATFGAGATMGAGMIGSAVMNGGNQILDAAKNGFKPMVQTSGGVGGSVGRMDYQYPYLIIKRGIPEYPNNWRAEFGAPQYQTYTLSDLLNTGYTLFSEIQLGNMGNATEEEKTELERLLKTEGVIL